MPDRKKWLKRIRESETFGRGSCTTVDEAMEDSELMEFLEGFEDFDKAWAMLCDVEAVHWERCSINWKPAS